MPRCLHFLVNRDLSLMMRHPKYLRVNKSDNLANRNELKSRGLPQVEVERNDNIGNHFRFCMNVCTALAWIQRYQSGSEHALPDLRDQEHM